MKPIIACPHCGILTAGQIAIYNQALRKQRFDISPVLPCCLECGAEVSIETRYDSGNVLVLNGTCGSGKSSVAEVLMKERGFAAVDTDCAMQVLKHKRALPRYSYDSEELFGEVTHEIDMLLSLGYDVALAHVIKPEDLRKWAEYFIGNNIRYAFFLLQPAYDVAVSRTKARTCHASITPEEWVRHYYDKLDAEKFDPSLGVHIYDNSAETAEETAARVLEMSGFSDELADR